MDWNWNEIKEKYPKAYHKSQQWFGKLRDIITWRHLYDFFDEQKLIIQIGYWADELKYWFDIYEPLMEDGHCSGNGEEYNTRTEAEEQAFIKAFEILENKL